MRKSRTIVSVVALCAVLALTGRAAQASFPGTNGKIAFVDGNTSPFSPALMAPDGSGVTHIGMAYDQDLAWSPDGSKIAFAGVYNSSNAIFVMNADGTGRTQLTFPEPQPPLPVAWPQTNPSWSPDGKKIAFEGFGNNYSTIIVMNADGTGQTPIGPSFQHSFDPVWSPDGSKILFNGGAGSPLSTMNPDGTDVHAITEPGQWFHPDWSPDASKIVVSNEVGGGRSQLYTMNADGSDLKQLLTSDARDYWPTWSPDGTKIAFARNIEDGPPRDRGTFIYVMDADGTDPVRISSGSDAGQPAWQPLGFGGTPMPSTTVTPTSSTNTTTVTAAPRFTG